MTPIPARSFELKMGCNWFDTRIVLEIGRLKSLREAWRTLIKYQVLSSASALFFEDLGSQTPNAGYFEGPLPVLPKIEPYTAAIHSIQLASRQLTALVDLSFYDSSFRELFDIPASLETSANLRETIYYGSSSKIRENQYQGLILYKIPIRRKCGLTESHRTTRSTW